MLQGYVWVSCRHTSGAFSKLLQYLPPRYPKPVLILFNGESTYDYSIGSAINKIITNIASIYSTVTIIIQYMHSFTAITVIVTYKIIENHKIIFAFATRQLARTIFCIWQVMRTQTYIHGIHVVENSPSSQQRVPRDATSWSDSPGRQRSF